MAGNEKEYLRDRIKLLYYAVLLFTLWLLLLAVFQNVVNFYIFVAFLIIGGFTYFKRKSIKKWVKKQLASKYPRVLISTIPTVVWGGFAVLGIFFFGLFIGLAFVEDTSMTVPKEQTEQVENYKDVISAYKNVSKLYFLQGQDMDIITDMSKWDQYPDEVFQAIASYKQKKDEIIFEYGRLYEIMRRAKVPTDPFLKTE